MYCSRESVFFRDWFTCIYCGKVGDSHSLHVDHIIPVSKGGSDFIYNLATACRDCNYQKKNFLLSDELLCKLFGNDPQRLSYLRALRHLALNFVPEASLPNPYSPYWSNVIFHLEHDAPGVIASY